MPDIPPPLLIPALGLPEGAPLDAGAAALEAASAATRLACVNWPAYPDRPDVAFRAGHTGSELWLTFDVREARVRALETRTHGAVYQDSCVECFIAFGDASYYNLELNCIGTAYLAYGAGREGRRLVPLPLMERLAVRASLGAEPFGERAGGFAWSLTARVPAACFAFDALAGGLGGRAARANFYACNGGVSVRHYVTWRPVQTPAPDFHRPEFFGGVRFE
ncbi:MAG: hypothetical protein LBW77_02545 [Verrucomicrobiota bacterium]|jgi:hypothetical protein|nr:hypothetical protein [Verrucomicrobiota bacterium]